MHSINRVRWLFFKGMAIGATDLIPGVSGGTIALITGVYEELLNSLKSINLHALKLLFKGQWSSFWVYVNGSFLLPLLIGIAFSVLSFSSAIHFLMSNYSSLLWSFFFGLIIVSSLLLLRQTGQWRINYLLPLVFGIVFSFLLTSATPVSISSPSLFIFFFAGTIAICAMILPGISGSLILLLAGLYHPLLQAVINHNFSVIFVFCLGCGIGLLLFSHLLSWLLLRFNNAMMGGLTGLMIGALNKAWPWKLINNDTGLQSNINPWNYIHTNSHIDLYYSVLCILAGILLVLIVEKNIKRSP